MGVAAKGPQNMVMVHAVGNETAARGDGAQSSDVRSVGVDVAVVGGGPTGALAALGAAAAGYSVALVAPAAGHDPRTTALLMPAVRLLDRLGVWRHAEGEAAALETMRIVDATERVPRAPEVCFDACEVGLAAFGYNIGNDALNAAIAGRLEERGVIRIDAVAEGFLEGSPAIIEAQGRRVEADLVVAADGSRSTVREQAGFSVRRWRYDQAAFVTTLSHERRHCNTSTEFHTGAGPFTLVPLPGERSSLVWVGRPDEVSRWAAMDPGPLAREVEARAEAILGRMAVDGPRGTIDLEGMIAWRFGMGRVVLVGEAAHRFPPIGAQGLNLGFSDVAALCELLAQARGDGALQRVPARYDARRRLEVGARTLGVDLLNRSLMADALPVTVMRSAALVAMRGLPGVRRAMMRLGLGAG